MLPEPLNLNQRLAALTQSPVSSPTSSYAPDSPLRSPSSKRRFNPPWMKRAAPQDDYDMPYGEERLQQVINKMIYQAGVDYE